MNCTNGLGYRENHLAEGWLYSPEGKPIVAMCRKQAEEAVAEYQAKLGEKWTFRGILSTISADTASPHFFHDVLVLDEGRWHCITCDGDPRV